MPSSKKNSKARKCSKRPAKGPKRRKHFLYYAAMLCVSQQKNRGFRAPGFSADAGPMCGRPRRCGFSTFRIPLPCGRGSEKAVCRYPVTAVLCVLCVLCVKICCRCRSFRIPNSALDPVTPCLAHAEPLRYAYGRGRPGRNVYRDPGIPGIEANESAMQMSTDPLWQTAFYLVFHSVVVLMALLILKHTRIQAASLATLVAFVPMELLRVMVECGMRFLRLLNEGQPAIPIPYGGESIYFLPGRLLASWFTTYVALRLAMGFQKRGWIKHTLFAACAGTWTVFLCITVVLGAMLACAVWLGWFSP